MNEQIYFIDAMQVNFLFFLLYNRIYNWNFEIFNQNLRPIKFTQYAIIKCRKFLIRNNKNTALNASQMFYLTLIVRWIVDTDLLANFVFNMCNNQTIVMFDTVTLNFLRKNATTYLFGFITQTRTVGKVKPMLSFRQWPCFLCPIDIDQSRWAPKTVELWNV